MSCLIWHINHGDSCGNRMGFQKIGPPHWTFLQMKKHKKAVDQVDDEYGYPGLVTKQCAIEHGPSRNS